MQYYDYEHGLCPQTAWFKYQLFHLIALQLWTVIDLNGTLMVILIVPTR